MQMSTPSHGAGRSRSGRPTESDRGKSSKQTRGRPSTAGGSSGATGSRRGPRLAGQADKSAESRVGSKDAGPSIPEWARPELLEEDVRDELSSLTPANASKVAGHLVAAGEFLDEDPQLALAHARAARTRASRLACVREAVGVAAYHAGEYAEASRELRAYRRLSGRAEYFAVLADCERAAGRPDAALRLLAEAPPGHPGHGHSEQSEWVEQQIVEAGARRDLGEVSGALLVLRDALAVLKKAPGIDADDLIRLHYAYADGLEAAGRALEAIAEFTAISTSDDTDMTDARDRAGLGPDGEAAEGDTCGPMREPA